MKILRQLLVLSLVTLALENQLASEVPGARLLVRGSITVNGHPATDQSVLFNGDRVNVGPSARAVILQPGLAAFLEPDTQVKYLQSDGKASIEILSGSGTVALKNKSAGVVFRGLTAYPKNSAAKVVIGLEHGRPALLASGSDLLITHGSASMTLASGSALVQDIGKVIPAQAPKSLHIVILDGEGALNNIRERTAREPIIQVEDENHKPVSEAAVVFLIHGGNNGAGASFGGNSLSFATKTGPDGRAQTQGLQAGQSPGSFTITVTATVGGVTAESVIHQTNAVGAPNPGPTPATQTTAQVKTTASTPQEGDYCSEENQSKSKKRQKQCSGTPPAPAFFGFNLITDALIIGGLLTAALFAFGAFSSSTIPPPCATPPCPLR